jgi:aminotransferase EvaB
MIKTFDYLKSLQAIEPEVLEAITRVLRSGRLILGPETEAFEPEFAAYVGAAHAVGVSSGTAAIHLALMAMEIGPGDEVITVSNTCAPTIAAIRLTGAHVVFVDVREDDLMMDVAQVESAITARTRCIVPVHLWGQAVDLDALLAVAKARGVPVVEDCAQAHGTTYRGRHVGTFGVMGCFSFYPTKNIGAYGDAGAVVTDDPAWAQRLRSIRMYGYDENACSVHEGNNARIAEIQAAVLRIKTRVFGDWLAQRRAVAAAYHESIDHPDVRLPQVANAVDPSYHQFVVRCRDRAGVMAALRAADVGFGVHYPVPVHLMPAYRFLGGESLDLPVTVAASSSILSLPIHEALTADEVQRVVTTLNAIESRTPHA